MSEQNNENAYLVLARKYRPRHFDELVGQDPLVRTLKNAITSGRLAQAYMLTGVRGVGKTTTARIIARAINYTGPDGQSGPTIGPTDDCPVAQAIAADRHPDVIEMDAASHTGVDDIREIIEGVRYAPASARYKVYIIDEVHMLSKAAFNALLKTLEEPPPHVKFIFATTEIRKVPITILSRCQRFDLRRLDAAELQAYFKKIAEWENVTIDEDAAAHIARAAGGSARDGLSILDQAIALAQGRHVTLDLVAQMLGLVDQDRVVDVLSAALQGQTTAALIKLTELNALGADATVIIEDLLNLTHALIKSRVMGNAAFLPSAAASTLSSQLTLPTLSRAWQILLRGLTDVAAAPDPFIAAEMTIIRLGYASTLPDPGKLLRTLSTDGGGAMGMPVTAPSSARVAEPVARVQGGATIATAQPALQPDGNLLHNIAGVIAALESAGQMILAAQVAQYVQVIKMEPGRIEFAPADGAPPRLGGDLGTALQEITGDRWVVIVGRGAAQPTYADQQRQQAQHIRTAVEEDPIVRGVLLAFPGTVIETIEE